MLTGKAKCRQSRRPRGLVDKRNRSKVKISRAANVAFADVADVKLNVSVAVKEKSLLLVPVVGHQRNARQGVFSEPKAREVDVVLCECLPEQSAEGIVTHFADKASANS